MSKAEIAEAVQEGLMKHEHELIALLGASALAEEQLNAVKSTHACHLCGKSFHDHDGEYTRATQLMEEICQRYLATIENSNLLNKRKVFLLLIRELKQKLHLDIAVKRSKAKFESEFSRGRAKALKELKLASLKTKKCLCCGSSLNSMGSFLKHVDLMLGTEQAKTTSVR